MNTNPFISSTSSNNVFTSNLYSNTSNNIFKTNNNNNTYNPFKVNNNNISTNTTSLSNNNDIFSRIKTNINDNSNNNAFNNNNFLNNMNNPFRTNNNTSSFNSTFTNNSTNNNFSYTNQNMKIYNFSNGLSNKLPICDTVGKTPINTFDHNIKIQRDYSEKNRINSIDYNNARIEYICVDDNLKNFSVEEIRINDYINAKIQYFDKWSNNDFNPNNQSINTFSNNFTSNILSNNNNINNNNTFSIFNKNNLPNANNGSCNTNPFLNNNNNNNIFNNNINNNPFNNNNNTNNNKLSFLNTNNTNNIFNNINSNPFNTSLNNNNNKNIFNNNTTGLSFLNNNTTNNTSNNNIFNNNNNNNIFNRNNNIFTNNTSNIFNTNNNNNNIFNTTNQNPFNSIFNNNNNNNNNNLINNNNLVNNIFNYNSNNFIDKPFEEKIKDPTWVKRNVKIIENKDLDNCFSDYINDISQVNLRVKEMQYFDFQEQENKLNEEEIIIEPKSLIFNKIMLASDEEIFNYNKKKSEEKKKEEKEKKEDDNENEEDKEDDREENKEKKDDNKKNKRSRWEPINIRNYKEDELSILNEKLENNITYKKDNNKKDKNKGTISGFAEASKILSNFDDNFVDFSFNNKEPKEYILPTEKQEFSKFNIVNSNKQSYRSSSFNENMNNFRFNERNNNRNIYNIYNQNMNNQVQSPTLMNNNEYNNQIFDINNIENIEESKNENIINNNNLINTISNKTTKINTDEVNRNLVILEEDINNENNIKEEMIENECKLIFIGDAGNINELKTPIIIQFSSIILNNENILNFDLILDIITKNILSIEDIENKIKIPNKEDIYLKIDGKLYSKLTNTLININSVDKNIDEKNGKYYYIYYGFKLKQYPLLLNDIDDIENKYMTNPKIEDILNPDYNYDLKRINNFEIWNKYGKIIFVDPIDLSGKIIINDIIKINIGNIDLSHERVDKLKARAFLHYDFGVKLEGTFLENIKYTLKTNKGTYVNYDNDNKILEYNINF